jgi:hypothetical protein
LNSKFHAVCDGEGRPLVMLFSEGQMSDFKGAALMLPALPAAKELWECQESCVAHAYFSAICIAAAIIFWL